MVVELAGLSTYKGGRVQGVRGRCAREEEGGGGIAAPATTSHAGG